jgi:hypothetical protein
MKKLISICLLLFYVVIGNAQENPKPKLNELTPDQLILELNKAQNTVTTGKVITLIGFSGVLIGTSILFIEAIKWAGEDNPDENTAEAGAYFMLFGSITSTIGIPVWIVGAHKRNKVELELAKFHQNGSASIYGIGLKIRF